MPLGTDAKIDLRVAEGLLRLLSGQHTGTAKRIGKKIFYRFVAQERQTLRGLAPVRDGRLRRAIKARSTRSGGAAVFVDKGRAPHFNFVESGTKQRQTKKGWRRGQVQAKPWIAPWRKRAQARYVSEVVEPLKEELIQQLMKGFL